MTPQYRSTLIILEKYIRQLLKLFGQQYRHTMKMK